MNIRATVDIEASSMPRAFEQASETFTKFYGHRNWHYDADATAEASLINDVMGDVLSWRVSFVASGEVSPQAN